MKSQICLLNYLSDLPTDYHNDSYIFVFILGLATWLSAVTSSFKKGAFASPYLIISHKYIDYHNIFNADVFQGVNSWKI